MTPQRAIKVLSEEMKNYPDYAWTWHCNLAMMAVDAGAGRKESNERAANFINTLFGVDTTKCKEYVHMFGSNK